MLQPSHTSADFSFDNGIGLDEVVEVYTIVSAWELLHYPKKDKILVCDFISNDEYYEHERRVTT